MSQLAIIQRALFKRCNNLKRFASVHSPYMAMPPMYVGIQNIKIHNFQNITIHSLAFASLTRHNIWKIPWYNFY